MHYPKCPRALDTIRRAERAMARSQARLARIELAIRGLRLHIADTDRRIQTLLFHAG